jgi:IS30 family transposase
MKKIAKQKQISFEERTCIEFLKKKSKNITIEEIANILGRAKSSISEELGRVKGEYSARKAQEHRDRKQYHKLRDWMKIVSSKELTQYVTEKIKEDWSPEEIAGRVQCIDTQFPPITAPSIYKYIYSVYGRNLEKYLRYGKQKRKGNYEHNVKISNRIMIDKRPKRVDSRRFFGDWEADFICSGKNGKGYLVVFVERKTRYCIIVRILSKDTDSVFRVFKEVLGISFIVNTLTIDNDIVFRRHEELSKLVGSPLYFTHPYHSWEKGTVENMNKWIRQYVKKSSDISSYSDEFISLVQERLNNRPRKCLGFRTPTEALLSEKSLKKDMKVIVSRLSKLQKEVFGFGV